MPARSRPVQPPAWGIAGSGARPLTAPTKNALLAFYSIEASMLASIRDPFQQLSAALAFAPQGVAGALILALAALIALVVHWIGVWLLRPLLNAHHPYWSALLHATKGPTRLAL